MSGVPGRRRSCRRKRILYRRRNLATSLSGSVFDPRTRLISQLRFCFESVSAMIYGRLPPTLSAWEPAARLKKGRGRGTESGRDGFRLGPP